MGPGVPSGLGVAVTSTQVVGTGVTVGRGVLVGQFQYALLVCKAVSAPPAPAHEQASAGKQASASPPTTSSAGFFLPCIRCKSGLAVPLSRLGWNCAVVMAGPSR